MRFVNVKTVIIFLLASALPAEDAFHVDHSVFDMVVLYRIQKVDSVEEVKAILEERDVIYAIQDRKDRVAREIDVILTLTTSYSFANDALKEADYVNEQAISDIQGRLIADIYWLEDISRQLKSYAQIGDD